MNKKLSRFVAALALCLTAIVSTSVEAVPVYDTFGPGNSYYTSSGWTVGSYSGYYTGDAFTVSQDSTLNFIELAAWLLAGTNDMAVTLRADSSGLPGTVLETFSFTGQLAPNSPTPSSANILTGTSLLNTLLTAGTQYWLIAEFTVADTWAAWYYGDTSTVGQHAYSSNGGQSWSLYPSVPLGALRIDATPVPLTAVPEPTTLSLLGAALLGFGLIRRRNRRT